MVLSACVVKLPVRELYWRVCLWEYGKKTKYIGFSSVVPGEKKNIWKRSAFAETEYIRFENIVLPAPKEFDYVLTTHYGDWIKPVVGAISHSGLTFDVDVPWNEKRRE